MTDVAHLIDREWMPQQPWSCPAGLLVTSSQVDRKTWLEQRAKGLGASDVAAVFGVSKWSTPWDVWAEKTGRVQPEAENDAMRRGRILEDGIADLWTATLPADEPVRLRRQGLMKHRSHSWMLATVDRLSVCRKGRCVVEIKSAINLAEWQGDEVPVAYQLQTQQQLAVTGRDHAHVIVLGPRFDIVERVLPRDDELIASMITQLAGWWQRHIVDDEEPHATAGAAVGLARLYGDADPGAEIELPKDLLTVSDEIRLLGKQIGDLTQQREELVARVKQTAGNASLIRSLGQLVATWKPTKTIAGATASWRKTNADLIAPYVTTETAEVLDLERLVAEHPELLGNGGPLYRSRQMKWMD